MTSYFVNLVCLWTWWGIQWQYIQVVNTTVEVYGVLCINSRWTGPPLSQTPLHVAWIGDITYHTARNACSPDLWPVGYCWFPCLQSRIYEFLSIDLCIYIYNDWNQSLMPCMIVVLSVHVWVKSGLFYGRQCAGLWLLHTMSFLHMDICYVWKYTLLLASIICIFNVALLV